jgi:uncharacterized membrane protein
MSAWSRIRDGWLGAVNAIVAVFVGLPFLAPILLATGNLDAANAIYSAYQTVCHQWAIRSYFLFGPALTYGPETISAAVGEHALHGFVGSPELGYKVAFCERDVAIYLAVLVGGFLYARYRHRISGLSLTTYGLLILPMALDGFTQLFGWRESTVLLRTLTGALFGLASVWLIYPRIDDVLAPDLAALAETGADGSVEATVREPSAAGPHARAV